MSKNLAGQYDERLQSMFGQWLAELLQRSPAELLAQAEDIFLELSNYKFAVCRSDEQKACALDASDLDYGAPASCNDFNPDALNLRAAVEAVCQGEHGEYPCSPLSQEMEALGSEEQRNVLLERLRQGYEDQICSAFLDMEKVDIVLGCDCYLRLNLFYNELHDWLKDLDMSLDAVGRLLRFDNPLDVLFTEYQGRGIGAYMGESSFEDLKDVFPSLNPPVIPEAEMRF